MWESRYNFIKPIRTIHNKRNYTLNELKILLNISFLTKNGHRISKIAGCENCEIEAKMQHLKSIDCKIQKSINNLTINMYNEHPESFENTLDQLMLNWTIPTLVEKILYPFLIMTGLLWSGNQLVEEHLVVTAIRKKLLLAVQSITSSCDKINPIILCW